MSSLTLWNVFISVWWQIPCDILNVQLVNQVHPKFMLSQLSSTTMWCIMWVTSQIYLNSRGVCFVLIWHTWLKERLCQPTNRLTISHLQNMLQVQVTGLCSSPYKEIMVISPVIHLPGCWYLYVCASLAVWLTVHMTQHVSLYGWRWWGMGGGWCWMNCEGRN